MQTDPIADMLTRIRNGYQAKKLQVEIPYSRFKEAVLGLLVRQGYLTKISTVKKNGQKPAYLLAYLRYEQRVPALKNVRRVSKPGRRVYQKASELRSVLGGYGITLISTSQGVFIAKEAKKKGLGGEVLCEVW